MVWPRWRSIYIRQGSSAGFVVIGKPSVSVCPQGRKSLRLCLAGLRICGFNSIAEATELPDHLGSAPLPRLIGNRRAAFFVTNSVVEDLPDEETLRMRNRPDSLFMSEARYHTTIDNLKDSSFSLDCRVGILIENAPHVAVVLRGSVAVVHARALLLTGTCTNPRGEPLARRTEGKVAAVAPTSAMILLTVAPLLGRSGSPRTRNSRRSLIVAGFTTTEDRFTGPNTVV